MDYGSSPPCESATLWEVFQRGITKSRLKGRRSCDTMERCARRFCGVDRLGALVDAAGIGPDTSASRVTEARIDARVESLLVAGYAPATINRCLAQLRRGFRAAYRTLDEYEHRLVNRVPEIELLAEDNVREFFPGEDDYRAIRDRLPWVLPYLLDFYRVTGYRKNEPLHIGWDRVDRAAGLIQLPRNDSKSRKWRAPWPYAKHPLLRAAIEALWVLKQAVERERHVVVTHLFFWEDGRPIKSFRGSYAKAKRAAGRSHIRIHDFRRMAARDLVKSHVDLKTARKLLGARTPSIFDRYNIVTDGDVSEAAESLARYHDSRAPAPQLVLPFERVWRPATFPS